MRERARFLAPLLAATLFLSGTPAFGQDADELARRHFESGVAYLQESDYDNALKAFEKSYELSKRPEILINIATVHERRNDLQAAVTALKKYLEVAPNGDQRSTVESRIANLEKRIAEEPPASADGGTTTTSDGGETTAPPGTVEPVKPEPTPAAAPNNTPAYILFGVGGLTAAGAVITGIMAKSKYDDAKGSCSPNCTDSQLSSSKSLALTSTVLTGVAIVSAGIGAVLFFTNKPTQETARRHERRWDVGFGVAPGGAAANALWRF